MSNKTIQNGYFKIKRGSGAGKYLHFSMNCWAELKNDTGKGMMEWSKGFYSAKDVVDKALYIADLVFAGAKANDLEEGNEIDYNIYTVRSWISAFGEEDIMEFMEALGWAANPNTGMDIEMEKK